MLVVDYLDRPLANMMPIATLSPNAFDQPIARGNLTGENGTSALVLPRGEELYLRAWDPALRMFANNFFTVPVAKGNRTPQVKITMVPASTLEATIFNASNQPVPNTRVKLMLVHEKHGPWWPSEAATDAQGAVRFTPLPPGDYILRFKAEGVGATEIPVTFLPPDRVYAAGTVTLR